MDGGMRLMLVQPTFWSGIQVFNVHTLTNRQGYELYVDFCNYIEFALSVEILSPSFNFIKPSGPPDFLK